MPTPTTCLRPGTVTQEVRAVVRLVRIRERLLATRRTCTADRHGQRRLGGRLKYVRDYREFLERVLHDHGTVPHRTCRSARVAGHIEAIVDTAAPSRAAVLERVLDERLRQRTRALEQVVADTWPRVGAAVDHGVPRRRWPDVTGRRDRRVWFGAPRRSAAGASAVRVKIPVAGRG